MLPHGSATDLREELTSYLLDLLDAGDTARIREHLERGCPACEAEIDELRQELGSIALSAPLEHPPASLRDRVVALAKPTAALPLHVVRKGEGSWATVAPGVSARRLYVDRERESVTVMLKMEPGATYAPHRHAGPEQCLVLEGELFDGEQWFRAGDFQCAPTGSLHGQLSTNAGCLLLIVASLHDQPVA